MCLTQPEAHITSKTVMTFIKVRNEFLICIAALHFVFTTHEVQTAQPINYSLLEQLNSRNIRAMTLTIVILVHG